MTTHEPTTDDPKPDDPTDGPALDGAEPSDGEGEYVVAGDAAPASPATAPAPSLPTVAVVGRPNVGKSTLVNRIVGKRVAIVEEKPGVTRDRKEVEADWSGRSFLLVDTGGWMPGGDALDAKVSAQSERALEEADVVLFVVDAVVGITEEDARVADLLRRARSTAVVVANKVDDANREAAAWELMQLGLGEPASISALHGRGTGDLLDRLVELLPPEPEEQAVEGYDPSTPGLTAEGRIFSIALVGRPNVGKSTLFNRMVGEDRAVVHDMPGTTRDSLDSVVETEHGPIRFVDTAGMRRKARIEEGTEYYSFVRALQAVDRSDVALLVIDATQGITHQDQRLAERVEVAGCPVVVVLNKWELLNADQRQDVSWQVEDKLAFLGESPVLKVSALSGKGVHKLLPALEGTVDQYSQRVPTRKVNEVVRAAQQAQPGPHGVRILYATQGATDPPTFTVFANKDVPPHYLRYIERMLREAFGLEKVPIKMRVRKRS